MPPTLFLTPRAMASAVLAQASSIGPAKATPRPWNQHEPDSTTWWLVPSTEWPAYPHGKFVFMPNADEAVEFLVGLHVEKGLGVAAMAGMLSPAGRSLITTDDWLWPNFLEDLGDGAVGQTLAAIEQATGVPPEILIHAMFMDPVAGDGAEQRRDEAQFSVSPDGLTLLQSSVTEGLLIDAERCETLHDLAGALASPPDEDWVWIDVYVVTRFTAQPDASEAWDAAQVWDSALQPLSPWFR